MPQADRGDLVHASEGRAAGEHLNAMSATFALPYCVVWSYAWLCFIEAVAARRKALIRCPQLVELARTVESMLSWHEDCIALQVFPPLVSGVTIFLIGAALIGSGFQDWGGASARLASIVPAQQYDTSQVALHTHRDHASLTLWAIVTQAVLSARSTSTVSQLRLLGAHRCACCHCRFLSWWHQHRAADSACAHLGRTSANKKRWAGLLSRPEDSHQRASPPSWDPR